jgi:hypothetical protein
MERHHVHFVCDGAFHELAASRQGAIGGQVEAVLPGWLFQVERMDRGIAEVEQQVSFVGNQDSQMAWRMTRGRNGRHARDDFSFAVDGLDLVA